MCNLGLYRPMFGHSSYCSPLLPLIHTSRQQLQSLHYHDVLSTSYLPTVRASVLTFTSHGFESRMGITAHWPWTSYLHLCASVTKQYNLVLAKDSDALRLGR